MNRAAFLRILAVMTLLDKFVWLCEKLLFQIIFVIVLWNIEEIVPLLHEFNVASRIEGFDFAFYDC